MEIKEFEFSLRDGRKAVIRSPKEEDVQAVIKYMYVTACDTEFVIRYPEECSKYTPEAEKELFRHMNSSNSRAMLLCLVDDVVAGCCEISWSTSLKIRHRADLAIAVVKDYWGLGIGTRMFQELIRIAEENEYITQLELDFIEGNTRGRAFYESFGFRITGVKPDAVRLKDGTMRNIISMVRKIER